MSIHQSSMFTLSGPFVLGGPKCAIIRRKIIKPTLKRIIYTTYATMGWLTTWIVRLRFFPQIEHALSDLPSLPSYEKEQRLA